jgi:FkbM family methyltransferase
VRILVVTHYFPPEIGAPQARLSELARAWADEGDEVTVLTGLPNHPTGIVPPAYRGVRRAVEQTDGYRVVRTWLYATPNEGIVKKTLGHLSFMVSSVVLGHAEVGETDVVVVSSPTFFAILSAWVLARRRRARFVVEIRDLWPAIFVELGVLTNPFVIKVLETLELAAYRAADAVVVVSDGFRDDLIRRSVPAAKIHTIRNGVDLDRFTPEPGDPDAVRAARASLGAGADDTLVLYIGAHGISHGLTAIADAAAQLRDAPIHVAFVGEGAAKPALEARVRELEAEGIRSMTLRAGVPRDEVAGLLQAADICLVPLRDVPLFATFIPSKIFEYFGAGRAVIGAVRGEPAEILREGGALVVEPEDVDAIAGAIRELAGDPDRRAAMGRTGHAYVRSHFDRRELARTYRTILRDVTAPRPSARPVRSSSRGTSAVALARFVWTHPETSAGGGRTRARALARVAGWQVWQRTTGRPLTITMPGGMKLRCHPHQSAASAVLYTGLPEWADMRFLLDLLQAGDTFVDVGANVGVYSLLAGSVAGTEVWAYEPSTEARARLVENIELNWLSSRTRVRPVAAGATPGASRLTVGLDCTNHLVEGERAPAGTGATEAVEVVRLDDDLRPRQPVALVKIDVEGHEAQVLDGARTLLAEAHPALVIEANDPAAIAAILEPLGYAPYRYEPRTRQLTAASWDPRTAGADASRNVLALHDVDGARRRVASAARGHAAANPRASAAARSAPGAAGSPEAPVPAAGAAAGGPP